MTDRHGNAPAPSSPADAAAALAAAAGVADLAAAAALDTAEGDGLLAACVRHEIALGHRLTMLFAAAGNAALDAACAGAASGDAGAAAADRMAARFGGAAARVMGNVRLALLSLARLPAPAEEQWVAVSFGAEALCSPAEAERRLAAAKAARAAAQGLPVAGDAAAASRALTAAEQARLAAARAAAAGLAAEAGVAALADAAGEWGRLKGFLRHELAAAHRLLMRLGGRAGDLLAAAGVADDSVAALRLASAAARLMARGRQALATASRLGSGPDGGPGRVAGYYWVGERDLFAEGPESAGSIRGGRPEAAGAASGTLRRGRLKNGNPSGDYLAAPRCGARTRAGGCCRQPAMANGRCRFHGGKSTGPRSAAGLARSRAARRIHGGYSAEIVDLRRAAAAHARRVRALAAAQPGAGTPGIVINLPQAVSRRGTNRSLPAGHGVHPLFFMAPPKRRGVR